MTGSSLSSRKDGIMVKAKIVSTGRYLPPKVVKNTDLEKMMDTSDEWIQQRTGIKERRFAEPGMTCAGMGAKAAKKALDRIKMSPSDVDCIIFSTTTPDYSFPGSGVLMQTELGIKNIPAYDIRNQCAGYLYALQMAKSFIESGAYQTVLVIGAEIMSTMLNLSTEGRNMAVLFGDGAGATILQPTEEENEGILEINVHSDGAHADKLVMKLPSSSSYPERITKEDIESGKHYPHMDGKSVFTHAVRRMIESMKTSLEDSNCLAEELDLLIPHQANLRISESVREHLKLPPEKVYSNIQNYGNTTAASIPIALDEAIETGKLKRGDLLGLVAFGSGFTWGASLIRY